MAYKTETLTPGLIFDGNQGYETNAKRVVELAGQYGFEYDEEELEDEEALHELDKEATEFLDRFAPDGHYVDWHEGDFGVWEIEG